MSTHREIPKRPKGILKNSHSSQNSGSPPKANSLSPSFPSEPTDNKELTLQNTLQNSGRRRSSSAIRRAALLRRLSAGSHRGLTDEDENGSRLKWDEANLYLAEQEKTAKMKIDEPKTPYAPHYDPSRDEDDDSDIDAEVNREVFDVHDIVVDELDKVAPRSTKSNSTKDHDIPDLELGEPEEDVSMRDSSGDMDRITRERSLSGSGGEKHVMVNNDSEADHRTATEGASEKHKQFEAQRKKHYEMKNIKDLLGHPEDLDAMEDEDGDADGDDEETPAPPVVPKVPEKYSNGTKS